MATPQSSKPGVSDRQDTEAVDLLMLFSTQSKQQNPSSASKPSETENEIKLENASTTPAAQPPLPPIMTPLSSKQANDPTPSAVSSIQMQKTPNNSMNTRLDKVARSPGPAAAALASGNSGNSSNKAIVAAAALAAAAATPLPILRKSDPPESIDNKLLGEPLDMNSNKPTSKRKREKSRTRENSNKGSPKTDKFETPKIKNEANDGPPPYAVGPDSGIISCICGYDHDDGLTIQCDKCFRWQHLVCMGFKSIDETPDDFQCNLCNKNLHVDVARAKKLQENYLKEEKVKRKRSPHPTEITKVASKNVGGAQFKKRKVDDTSSELVGVNKYSTLYYPIDYFIYQSSSVKTLFTQFPELLKKNKQVIKIEKQNLAKLISSSNAGVNIKNSSENAKTKFTGISKLGLYSTKPFKDNSFISILSGEVETKQNYISEKINKYWLLGCPKPSVYFHPNLPIVIDQRGMGNHTRFIRKSCKPNCEIRTMIINKQEITFGVFAIKEIKADQEITLPWEWDIDHPILQLINNAETFETMDAETKMVLINSIQGILDLTECANSAGDCVINKVKKQSAYLQRNTRKNNISHLSPTPNQKYVSIDHRYQDRNELILKSIANTEKNLHGDESFNNDDSYNMQKDPSETSDSNVIINEDGVVNFNFKTKTKNTIYNLHILPKQFELLRQYYQNSQDLSRINLNTTNDFAKEDNITPKDESKMPMPIDVNPKVLQKLQPVSADPLINGTKEIGSALIGKGTEVDEKPKIVKKFSLADYKRKKTS